MAKHSIALIGFRATGKSLIGKLLGEKLAMDFMDMDDQLVVSLGRDIDSWVRLHGWESFRDAESRLLDTLAERDRIVLATGGGVVLRPSNRKTLEDHFLIAWLQASPATIHRRLSQDPKTASHRPPLTDLPMKDEINRVIQERYPLYEEIADLILDTDAAPPAELVSQIQAFWEKESEL
jgi:shikimate kinase